MLAGLQSAHLLDLLFKGGLVGLHERALAQVAVVVKALLQSGGLSSAWRQSRPPAPRPARCALECQNVCASPTAASEACSSSAGRSIAFTEHLFGLQSDPVGACGSCRRSPPERTATAFVCSLQIGLHAWHWNATEVPGCRLSDVQLLCSPPCPSGSSKCEDLQAAVAFQGHKHVPDAPIHFGNHRLLGHAPGQLLQNVLGCLSRRAPPAFSLPSGSCIPYGHILCFSSLDLRAHAATHC